MSRRISPRGTPAENIRIFLRFVPWKLLLLIPILAIVAIPIFIIGVRMGGGVMPTMNNFFYVLTDPSAIKPTPTVMPPLSISLPQTGNVLYTVQSGDNCVSILAYEMHMNMAGQIFSDAKPETVKALNQTLGVDCHKLQPDNVVSLPPHYPLAPLGGIVQKIEATVEKQVLPTPLIPVTREVSSAVDCSHGCLLTVSIAKGTQVQLVVKTDLQIHVGSWVWALAGMQRKQVSGFATYPYVDPAASMNGTRMQACDLQVDNTRDEDGVTCDDLNPNTVEADGGSWLLGVTGPGALDHWGFNIKQSVGTQVMLWLSYDRRTGQLKYLPGNPAYRYDASSHLYNKMK
jgi:hypothetical protein